jgi:hypothetical protein
MVEKGKELIPGPGKYDSHEQDLSNKKYSFTRTSKFTEEEHSKEKMPGPGSYEIAHSRNKIKSGKFTKALRNFLNSDKVPGPGSYQVEKSLLSHEGGSIVQQKRSFNYENGNPGPGKYDDVPVDTIKKREGFTVYLPPYAASAGQRRSVQTRKYLVLALTSRKMFHPPAKYLVESSHARRS